MAFFGGGRRGHRPPREVLDFIGWKDRGVAEVSMASEHTVADNIVYDLISIQYHALKGAEVYDRFLEDTHSAEHQDVTQFILQCKREDEQRAVKAHELLGTLTRSHGLG